MNHKKKSNPKFDKKDYYFKVLKFISNLDKSSESYIYWWLLVERGGGLHHIHCPENKPKRLLDAIAILILGKTLENNQNILDIKEMLRGMRVIGLHEKY